MRDSMQRRVSTLADRVAEVLLRRQRLDSATSPATKLALRQLALDYRDRAARGAPLPSVADAGFRVFSQFDEDGILHFLLAVTGAATRRFVDIGAGDGLWAGNTANLAFNLGFDGLFVEADERSIERGRRVYATHPDTSLYPPRFVRSMVTRENVNAIVRDAGVAGEVDVLSIDIDGNDYWIWEALDAITPRLVVIESRIELGARGVVQPYAADFRWDHSSQPDLLGASPDALARLGERKGYRLVGANRFGFNLFFVRDDLAPGLLPAVPAESLLSHPRTRTRLLSDELVASLPFERR